MYILRQMVISHKLFSYNQSADLFVGIITGLTGAAGDLGGIVFLLIARYSGNDYARVFWIVGVFSIGGNLLVSWIRPIPKGQLGGR